MEDVEDFLRDTGIATDACVPCVDEDAYWEPCPVSCVDGSPIRTV